jgi:superfamily II DNA/RNA helicase
MDFDLQPADVDTSVPEHAAPASPFAELGLRPELQHALAKAGYHQPTDVQTAAIPPALQGQDLLVSARTGSGKTAAFVLPALQGVLMARLDPNQRRAKGVVSGPRVLVLAPTRELAQQVARAATVYGRDIQGLRVATVVGGVPYGAQIKALRGPLDLLVATPGRLMDLMGSGTAVLAQVRTLVLDEADRMLDMGFIDDIRLIADALPPQRQTLMFSATFGGEVGQLARQLTRNAQRLDVAMPVGTPAAIEQRLHWADGLEHKQKLLQHLLADTAIRQAVVFTGTQRDADMLADDLYGMGHAAGSLHGGMPQGRRQRVLQALRQGQLRVLVATDVAARGIDVPEISHVINWGLPMVCEDYVHRIGRTGRAGRTGIAITLAERRDMGALRRVERFTGQPLQPTVVPGLEPRMKPARQERPTRSSRMLPAASGAPIGDAQLFVRKAPARAGQETQGRGKAAKEAAPYPGRHPGPGRKPSRRPGGPAR